MIILTYLHGCSVFAKASQGRFRHRERISPRGEVEPNEGRVCVTQWRVSIRFGGLRICSRRDQRGNHASAAITTSLLSRSIRRLPVGGLLCEQSFACARNRDHPSFLANAINLAKVECFRAGVRRRERAPYHDHRRADARTCIRVRLVRRVPESWLGEYERAPLREPSYCGAKQHHTGQGLVRQQVAGLLADHPDPVSFRHADCDLYSSRVLSRAARGAMEPEEQRKRDVWAHCARCGALRSSKPERSEETR